VAASGPVVIIRALPKDRRRGLGEKVGTQRPHRPSYSKASDRLQKCVHITKYDVLGPQRGPRLQGARIIVSVCLLMPFRTFAAAGLVVADATVDQARVVAEYGTDIGLKKHRIACRWRPSPQKSRSPLPVLGRRVGEQSAKTYSMPPVGRGLHLDLRRLNW